MIKLNKKRIKSTALLITSLLFLVSCNSNPLEIDVSDVSVDLKIHRMEQELFKLPVSNYELRNEQLLQKYGFLYEAFMMDMIGEGSPYDPMAGSYLQGFIADSLMQNFNTEIQNHFGDFSKFENSLVDGFKHYKYYFPDSTIPEIITFYSNFNANAFPYGNRIAIGLDMYLGANHKYVKSLPNEVFPQFIKEKMEDKYLVADVMKSWLLNRFSEDLGGDFLSKIISLGKVMYILDAMLPEEEDYIKFGSSKEKLDWCVHNEQNIWKTIVKDQVLYSKDQARIMQYVTDGPFTKDMPHESPARVGVWLGWQIVKDYMFYNDVTIEELVKQKSAKLILKSYSQGDRE